jgi:hypothetical protein
MYGTVPKTVPGFVSSTACGRASKAGWSPLIVEGLREPEVEDLRLVPPG